MLLATMPELSSHEKRVGRHHTHLARYLHSQQSSYLRFRLQFSGKVAVIAKVRLASGRRLSCPPLHTQQSACEPLGHSPTSSEARKLIHIPTARSESVHSILR